MNIFLFSFLKLKHSSLFSMNNKKIESIGARKWKELQISISGEDFWRIALIEMLAH